MKITSAEYHVLKLEMNEAYTIAYESIDQATNIILKIECSNGLTGWGCAAPDLTVTGESPENVIENLNDKIIPLLIGQNPLYYQRINFELAQKLGKHRSSLAMVDIALMDVIARKANIPLFHLLGAYRNHIETSITVGIMPLTDMLNQAKEYIKKGFRILKIKGGLHVEEDIEKVLKLHEKYGNSIRIRFDGNQGYSPEEAIYFVQKTLTCNIEIFEQPTAINQDLHLGEVTEKTKVPVMADESVMSLKDAFRLARHDQMDMVNIKLQKVGGINTAMHINSIARAAGLEVMVGCIDECGLGISAGLHFALSRPNVEFADLDGHLDFIHDPFKNLIQLKNGILYPSDYPGLGKVDF